MAHEDHECEGRPAELHTKYLDESMSGTASSGVAKILRKGIHCDFFFQIQDTKQKDKQGNDESIVHTNRNSLVEQTKPL